MAGSLTLGGSLTGVPSGSATVGPYTIAATTGNLLQVSAVNLASGANTITVPAWAAGVVIIPAASNVIALTVKGVAGDTGLPISPTDPFLWNFAGSPPANFVVNAGSAGFPYTTFIFF